MWAGLRHDEPQLGSRAVIDAMGTELSDRSMLSDHNQALLVWSREHTSHISSHLEQ